MELIGNFLQRNLLCQIVLHIACDLLQQGHVASVCFRMLPKGIPVLKHRDIPPKFCGWKTPKASVNRPDNGLDHKT